MSTTHAAMGGALAAVLVPFAPELAPVAVLGAMAGGVFPDLDIVLDHRKSLHFPEQYWLVATPSAAVALLWPSTPTVLVASFLTSAAIHSLTDVVGGGLGRRPWLADDHRGVYSHRRNRWLRPRRWIRYDGAPEDLLATAVFAFVPWIVLEGALQDLVVGGLAISIGYVILRKRLPDLYERFLV